MFLSDTASESATLSPNTRILSGDPGETARPGMVVVVCGVAGAIVTGGNLISGSTSSRPRAELAASRGRLSDSRLATRSITPAATIDASRPQPGSCPRAAFTRLPEASRAKSAIDSTDVFHNVIARIPCRMRRVWVRGGIRTGSR